MAKKRKSKAERNAIRKQGWQEVKEGIIQMGKASDNQAKTMLKAAGNSLKNDYHGRVDYRPEHAIASVARAGKSAIGAGLSNVPNTFTQTVKGGWKAVKGVFKGIFNHPEWYAYNSILSKPAYNENRPFSSQALKSASGTLKSTPGIGCAHVVKQNVVYHDMRNSDSFKLATIEAFKDIRLMLKSNLPYRQENYDDFIAWAVAIFVKCKSIERELGWYNVTRADIPELSAAMHSIPLNMTEIGKVTPAQIAMLSDSEYSTTLNKYNQLKAIVQNIAIPEKLADFISWWCGSVFIDQAAPNPQVYVNEMRDVPIFNVDNSGVLFRAGTWDVATGTIQQVIDEAMSMLNQFGIMNADITKTGKYGSMKLAPVERGEYQPITLCDYEFFSILINSYAGDRNSRNMADLFNTEYIRVDVLDQLNPANLVGVVNGLAHWAGQIVPFEIISQAVYFPNDITMRSPRNSSYIGQPTGTVYYSQHIAAAGDYWYQLTGDLEPFRKVKILQASSTAVRSFTANAKYSGSGISTIASGTISPIAGYVDTYGFASADTYDHIYKIGVDAAGTKFFYLRLSLTSGAVTGAKICYTATDYPDGTTVYGFTPTDVATLSIYTNVAASGNRVYTALFVNNTAVTIVSGQEDEFLGLFTVGSAITELGNKTANVLTLTTTTGSGSNTFSIDGYNTAMIQDFVEVVDYHIPIVINDGLNVSDGTNDVWSYNLIYMMKETYIPLLFNYSDIEAVIYWMYLGLFSINSK